MLKIDKLIFDFLNYSYPITRVKHNNRFKRGVTINGRDFLFPKDKLAIIGTLYNIVETTYSISPEKISYIIEKHYNLK